MQLEKSYVQLSSFQSLQTLGVSLSTAAVKDADYLAENSALQQQSISIASGMRVELSP